MNLSPAWVPMLQAAGHEATHWSEEGDPRTSDREIMAWDRAHGACVLTHDLDPGSSPGQAFGALLAVTDADGPSVLQIRAQDVLPEAMAPVVLAALRQFEPELARGALVTVDPTRHRARLLPLAHRPG